MNVDARNRILSVVLFVVIIVLGYLLYDSIVTPWQTVKKEQAITEKVRTQMSNVREALNLYKSKYDRFPSTLDSMVFFVKTDSTVQANLDSTFTNVLSGAFSADSLIFSPRTGNRFGYMVNDTLRPPIYLLTDPDNEKDFIGDTLRTTSLNAASWE